MNATIEGLLVLQARDLRVAQLSEELEQIPRKMAALQREWTARKEQFGELKSKTRLVESDRKKLELEVKSKEAAIARYKAQQLSTRKNEEFAALNHEIEHTQAEISKLEDSELELMEAYDAGLVEVASGEKELAQAEQKTKQREADLQKREQALQAELKSALEQQAVAEEQVPEEHVARYRRILKSKGDTAIVPIHSGACSGCHMKLTTQTVVSARGTESLTSCENCGRIVYPE